MRRSRAFAAASMTVVFPTPGIPVTMMAPMASRTEGPVLKDEHRPARSASCSGRFKLRVCSGCGEASKRLAMRMALGGARVAQPGADADFADSKVILNLRHGEAGLQAIAQIRLALPIGSAQSASAHTRHRPRH